jgi:hypothetical protein
LKPGAGSIVERPVFPARVTVIPAGVTVIPAGVTVIPAGVTVIPARVAESRQEAVQRHADHHRLRPGATG